MARRSIRIATLFLIGMASAADMPDSPEATDAFNPMEAMSVAVILIDANAITQVTPQQLADYIAMRSFAKVGVTANLSSTPTILRLFAPEGGVPAELTDFDRAFLRGPYRTAYAPANQRLAISASMTRQLTRQD